MEVLERLILREGFPGEVFQCPRAGGCIPVVRYVIPQRISYRTSFSIRHEEKANLTCSRIAGPYRQRSKVLVRVRHLHSRSWSWVFSSGVIIFVVRAKYISHSWTMRTHARRMEIPRRERRESVNRVRPAEERSKMGFADVITA